MISGMLMIVEVTRYISFVGTSMGVLTVIPFLFPKVFEFAIPLSILLGTLLTFSRLTADNEIHAMYTFKINFAMILSPVFVISFFIAIFSLVNAEWVSPWSSKILMQVKNKTIIDLVLNKINEEDRYMDKNLSVIKLDGKHGVGKSVYMSRNDGETTQEILAENLKLIPDYKNSSIKLQLTNANISVLKTTENEFQNFSGFSESCEFSINLSKELISRKNSEKSFNELLASSADENNTNFGRRKNLFEVHRKLSSSLSCIFLGILGFFMGLRMNTGSRFLGIFLVISLVLIVYLPSIVIGKWLVLDSSYQITPWVGGWLPFILIGIVTFLLRPKFKGA
jgi:lipopolysaccharide export LptBFGC system permease protein LptF